MKLSDAYDLMLYETAHLGLVAITEEDEGPKWRFDYSNFITDPHPEILMLGTYNHPSTHNYLVGGINIHYLNDQQIDKLSRALPQIMSGKNLYYRYHIGKRVLPDVFQNFYRTYNANYIRGVKQDVMYPKYGYLKAARQWLKNKISGALKSPEQRKQDVQPDYPKDISNVQVNLDKAVAQAAKTGRAVGEPEDTPEMQAAADAFRRYQAQKTMTPDDVKAIEDMPLDQAQADSRENELDPEDIIGPADFEIEPEEENPEDFIESLIYYYDPQKKRYIFESFNPTAEAASHGIQRRTCRTQRRVQTTC